MADATTTNTLITAAEAVAKTHDPTLSSFLFVGFIIFMLVVFAKPLIALVKDAKGMGVAEAKIQAEEALFDQLRKQVEANQAAIEKLTADKERWFEQSHKLEKEVERLQLFEKQVENMKKKLDEKDKVIASRDEENKRLMFEILQLKDRIHDLELRLFKDEAEFKLKTQHVHDNEEP